MKTYPIDSTFTVKDLMQVLEDMDPSGTSNGSSSAYVAIRT